MNCPGCKRETEPMLFCHFCDAYMTDPAAGTRAGVARRFAAQLLDSVAIWVIIFIILAVTGVVGGASESVGLTLTTFFWAFLGYVIFALWFLSQGKTPGKWLVGIRVVDKRQGSVPGFGRMLVRETIGKIVSGFFLGIGYFWAIFDRDGQAWHDKIAGTVVLRQSASQPTPAPVPSLPLAAAAGAAALNPPPVATPRAAPAGQAVAAQRVPQFCGECGAKIEAGSQFCESCGARQ